MHVVIKGIVYKVHWLGGGTGGVACSRSKSVRVKDSIEMVNLTEAYTFRSRFAVFT